MSKGTPKQIPKRIPKQSGSKSASNRGKSGQKGAPSARRSQPLSAVAQGKKTARRARALPQTAKTSSTEEAMEERLATLEPGTLRHSSLATAIEFKRSWLDLARALSEVSQSGEFKEWGYRTFEAYGQHELHLRRETMQKLLRSYDFLATHERRLLEGAENPKNESVPLPSFQALDVLAEARSNPYLSERDYRELRDQVFTQDPTAAQLRRAVRDRAPEPKKSGDADRADRLPRSLAIAERLLGMLLEQDDIPARIVKALEEVVGGLRALVEE